MLQDGGRNGYQNLGITTGGPVDSHAFAWANRLLGNEANLSQVEVCFGDFTAQFTQNARFALTGADLDWRLDDVPLRRWRTHQAKAGAVLSAGVAHRGLRSYLAVQGGFDIAPVLGSCATVAGDQLGGLGNGAALKAGDQLPFKMPSAAIERGGMNRVPKLFIPDYFHKASDPVKLRVVPSNQYELFTDATRSQIFRQTFVVSNRTDRMGCRLEGETLQNLPGNMVSEAVPLGAIQVPSDGQPIILLQDRQTIGGYPKFGNVYAVDLSKLAQCKPGDHVQLVPGDLAEAQYELCLFRQFFNWHPVTVNSPLRGS